MIRSNAIQYNRYKAFPNNVLLKKYTIQQRVHNFEVLSN